jgi:hypothetical protein
MYMSNPRAKACGDRDGALQAFRVLAPCSDAWQMLENGAAEK